MADGEGNWCLIESDPGVFTELIKQFGVKGAQVEELWSLDTTYDDIKPAHGLIFLFKWFNDPEPTGTIVTDHRLDNIYFAAQVINNACATQALLSVLFNVQHEDINLGPTLTEFKEFCSAFNPEMKGLTLSNSETIRSVHNSFARQQLFEFDGKSPAKNDDVFHFVSYVPVDGYLYELDGLKPGPIDHGAIPKDSNWMDYTRSIIKKRISRYNEGEIHFSLMAVVSDRTMLCEKQIAEIEAVIQKSGMETDAQVTELARLRQIIEVEEMRRNKHQIENVRRKHNYLPLIVELLKILAREQRLVKLYESAKQKCLDKEEKNKPKYPA